MNAQTPAWQGHLGAIDSFMPGLADEERALRARVMFMRDRANQIMRQHEVDWAASQLLGTIQSLGHAYALAPIDAAELQSLRTSMAELFRIAASLEVIGRGR